MRWFRWGRGPVESAKNVEEGTDGTRTVSQSISTGSPDESEHRRVTAEQLVILNQLYWEMRDEMAVDSLPYTEPFERIYEHFLLKTGLKMSRHSVWRALLSHRKAGKLKPPEEEEEDKEDNTTDPDSV